MTPFDIEPMPSTLALAPPEIDASFHARERDRLPTGGWQGRSSARPEALRGFVYESFAANQAIKDEQTRLQRAWVSFTRECSWIPVVDRSFVVGMTGYLMENRHDEDWVDSIAKAYERINELPLGGTALGATALAPAAGTALGATALAPAAGVTAAPATQGNTTSAQTPGVVTVTNLQLTLDTVNVLPQQISSVLTPESLGTDQFLFAISYLTT